MRFTRYFEKSSKNVCISTRYFENSDKNEYTHTNFFLKNRQKKNLRWLTRFLEISQKAMSISRFLEIFVKAMLISRFLEIRQFICYHFFFVLRTGGLDGMITSMQHDKDTVGTRERTYDVEDLHIQQGRVSLCTSIAI